MGGSLSHSLYTAEQVRRLDAEAIHNHGIPGIELMKRAGQAAFDAALENWPALGRGGSLQVFCGAGNNAGDGYIIAALARRRYIPVRVIALRDPELLKGDAREAWEWFKELGGHHEPWTSDIEVSGTLLVDALLGTGLNGAVSGDFADAIELINHSGKPVLAVDIPSGLSADTGAELGTAVRADMTVTFIGLKQGLYTCAGPCCCGQVVFSRLKVPEKVYKSQNPSAHLLCEQGLSTNVQPRKRDAHKGDHGHLLVIGGDHGMGGAALMAAEAAIRCGVGLVTLATRPEHVMASLVRQPEVMVRGVESAEELFPLLNGKTSVVIGPGLGQDSWGIELLKTVLASDLPILLDADALNLISLHPELFSPRKKCVITPHPGEAARLLSQSVPEVSRDRFAAVKALQALCGGVAVLKGAGTLIQGPKKTGLCNAGNPGMGVAGMGDVLSGAVGALMAQGHSCDVAASLGVWLHACAGDACAQSAGERGMAATDLIPVIRQKLNALTGQG